MKERKGDMNLREITMRLGRRSPTGWLRTIALADEPQGRDLDAALAKVLGWTDVEICTAMDDFWGTPPGIVFDGDNRKWIPHYSYSLDALARDVEPEIARRGLWAKYANAVADAQQSTLWWDFLTTPARTRAASAWRVLSESPA